MPAPAGAAGSAAPSTETHSSHRVGWLRASVLGANDGIVSVASIIIGVSAARASLHAVLIAGVAGLVAGALSMASGEFVSVSSQKDAERADMALERAELATDPAYELEELTKIYEGRGLDRDLAEKVAARLMEVDPLGAHLRDELGFSDVTQARPFQAAVASAASFTVGGGIPVLAMGITPAGLRIPLTIGIAIALLAAMGALGARLGGAGTLRGALRVTIGGIFAMALTAGIGRLVSAAGL